MIARAIVVALALATGSAPALAQDFFLPSVDADPGVLLRCLGSGKAATTCLGAMTVDCLAENDLQNDNLEERMCAVEELLVWRDLAAREQERLRLRLSVRAVDGAAVLPGDPMTLAEAAQRGWQDWAEAECRLARAVEGAGDRRAIVEDICIRDLTAAHYGRLRSLNARLGG